MKEFKFKKKSLTHPLFDGKRVAEFQENNSRFVDVNRKPDTRGYRPSVMSKKRKGNF